MSGEDNCIPLLAPGETAGPFEIQIPWEVIVWLTFKERTTAWERLLLHSHLASRRRRREIYDRLSDLIEVER